MDDSQVTAQLDAAMDALYRLGVYPTGLRMERRTLVALYVERHRWGAPYAGPRVPLTYRGILVEPMPAPRPPDYYTDNPPR